MLRQADLSARRPLLRGVTWKKLLRWVESRWAREGDSSAPGGIKEDQQSWASGSLPVQAKLRPFKSTHAAFPAKASGVLGSLGVEQGDSKESEGTWRGNSADQSHPYQGHITGIRM